MSSLFKSGVWTFALSVIGFCLVAGGVCGPKSDLGGYLAEATMVGAPVGIAMCILAGLRALVKRKPEQLRHSRAGTDAMTHAEYDKKKWK
jgi:hypothetical protein